MSTLTHGGRIVPILTSHEQHQQLDSTTPSPDMLLEPNFPQSTIDQPPLLDQRVDSEPMRRKNTLDLSCLEMPCLKERGLFAFPTQGDGNCLYYSLSDQLYGNFDHGDEIRHHLADHMANNKTYFMQFVVAQGGERRRPKRAAVSAYATRSAEVAAASEEDKERRFTEMVAATRKNGEWGSSEHLQAFCQVYRADINVYTMGGIQAFRDVNASSDEHRDVVHVAFHDFKHYSSVRPLDGTHKGLFAKPQPQALDQTPLEPTEVKQDIKTHILPDIKDQVTDTKLMTPPSSSSPSSTPENPETLNPVSDTESSTDGLTTKAADLAVDVFPPWDIQSIQDGLGGRYDRDTIVDMLQKCRGDIDRAFAALLGENNDGQEKPSIPGPNFKPSLQASRESSPFSTGSKRSADDSDDSEDQPPTSRRGRPKKRIVSNLTLGVGISFRDDQNEVVSLNLRMEADAEKAKKAEKAQATPVKDTASPEPSAAAVTKGPRRSGRLSKPRPA
ncbi:uncharacterized protein N7496_007048 [Penicillium cataractarum]|uniref:OTU domain-containing protein n=1 Tax=Penicillium cataractarum TaxID=2100454 RepID=A0A9W9S2U7_9EURO|nr:uncharacterized protein N7496_007048 [Penicillium cataractarum]KAJ5370956.1 hypothetical protein N7496_007048 [Penicillium cataractarum]